MELRQLRYFERVAALRSFSRAAAELHVAQSALSQQVRKLEAELGTELLRRTTRKVEPTQAGELALVRARRMLAEAESLRDDLDGLAGLVRGRVALGGVPPVGGLHPARMIADFKRAHPGVDFQVREDTAGTLFEMLRGDRIDLVLALVAPGHGAPAISGVQLVEEELVVCVAADHPLAASKRVTMARLARCDLVAYGPRSALRDILVQALEAAGLEGRFALEANELETVKELAALGLGATLIPRSVARDDERLQTRPLTPKLTVPVSLLWREGRRLTPAASAFAEHVIGAVRAGTP